MNKRLLRIGMLFVLVSSSGIAGTGAEILALEFACTDPDRSVRF